METEEKIFWPGDVVHLKSEPNVLMTIVDITQNTKNGEGYDVATCLYFSEGKLIREVIPTYALIITNEELS